MTGPAPRFAGGTGSAQPGPRQRKKPKPAARLNPHQSIRLIVRSDGSFVPADDASRKLCRDRGMYSGIELIAYLYEPRDGKQWRQAHQVGTFLKQNLDEFSTLSSHEALKKVQLEGRIACIEEKLDLGAHGEFIRIVPESLAYGFMDESRWTEVYRQMCTYIGKKYFHLIDGDIVADMERLMLREQAA